MTCQRWKQSAQPDEIEFHHINADSKADCVSNIVYRHYIVYRQPPAPVTFVLETLKCAPMCHLDHKQLHDAEKAGNAPLLADRFDLTGDDQYQKLNGRFWQMVIGKAPPEVKNEIHETLLDMLDDGQIIFGPQGFALASPPPRTLQVTP